MEEKQNVENGKVRKKLPGLQIIAELFIAWVMIIYSFVMSWVRWLIPKTYKYIGDDIVLITGGGRGLGKHLAMEFSKFRPKHIVIWGRDEGSLESTASEVKSYGVPCTYMVCDVSDKEQIYKNASELRESIGDVTILVNNAGIITGDEKLLAVDASDITRTLDINIMAHIWTLKAFLPHMVKTNHGHVICVSSVLGLFGLRKAGPYSASKFSSIGLMEALTLEAREHHDAPDVHVTIVCPYVLDNHMFRGCTTRFPRLIPVLSETYVAERVLDAMLTNQKLLIMPRIMYLIWTVYNMFPMSSIAALLKFVRAQHAMDTFHAPSTHIGLTKN